MNEINERLPNPKEIEKEIGEFLAKKFGDNVKIVSPMVFPQELVLEDAMKGGPDSKKFTFDFKPEDLIAYLDQYIVKQDEAKAILSTKICTHFNRIKQSEASGEKRSDIVGSIKNNVLMIGPTGVGKTYMIKLIADKIGVPFVKGDATKFSETGYVGGDVEDLVRDLVRAADDDIELAQYGIIYIDEIDKIAGSRNLIGADVSRTGVQRALLKPMEETEVDLKVPHDPISMIQEIERFRKTGKRDKRAVNTANILFIMSGAFGDITDIIRRRVQQQPIGFGADITEVKDDTDFLKKIKAEDLIEYGFESEFVGRLPVRAVFEKLEEADLFEILKNPNNPIVLGKKLDFAAYGIDAKFESGALQVLAERAFQENTGARGLVSAVERALLSFETKLPSTPVKKFPVTLSVIEDPDATLRRIMKPKHQKAVEREFDHLYENEKEQIKEYLNTNKNQLASKYKLTLTRSRIDLMADYYARGIQDLGKGLEKVKSFYDDIKDLELFFFKNHDINLVLEEDAIDFIIAQLMTSAMEMDQLYNKLAEDFEHGLKLIRERTGTNRFFLNREALLDPELYISNHIKKDPDSFLPDGGV